LHETYAGEEEEEEEEEEEGKGGAGGRRRRRWWWHLIQDAVQEFQERGISSGRSRMVQEEGTVGRRMGTVGRRRDGWIMFDTARCAPRVTGKEGENEGGAGRGGGGEEGRMYWISLELRRFWVSWTRRCCDASSASLLLMRSCSVYEQLPSVTTRLLAVDALL